MYNYDIRKVIIQTSIGQLFISINAAKSRNSLSTDSNRNNLKEKILLVEGKSDIEFWKRILSDTVLINDVKGYADSVCKLLGKRTNNKATVIEICKAANSTKEIRADSQSIPNTWKVNGVIDRDFDDREYDSLQYLHVTDTHDLETMLIYSDPEIFQRLEIANSFKLHITNEQVDRAKRLSLQMGWIKMAINILPREERNWFYLPKKQKGNQVKIEYSMLINKGNLDILQYLYTINDLQLIEDRKDGESLGEIKKQLLSTGVLKNRITPDGIWFEHISDDELETWKVINGHDYLSFLRCIVPGAEEAYKSGYKSDNALEFDLIHAYETKEFTHTKLYSSMCRSTFIERT